MSLRVNLLKITRKDYAQKLKDKGITELKRIESTGIILDESYPVIKLPGFMEGEVSYTRYGCTIGCALLLLKPGQTVLDACAAPGGKTTHILEAQPDLVSCVAVDHDAIRLNKVTDNLNRLRL